MNGQAIIDKVKTLNLPTGSYIVFGSCPLALAGLRQSQDIDLLVSEATLEQLKAAGWQQIDKGIKDKPFVDDVFEAHTNWNFGSYRPTLEGLLATATVVEGVAFASLGEVRKWKAISGRPKDLHDIELIDAYLHASIAD